ncbi:MAG: amidohydrolase [Promethearchaeati archaeon]
MDDTDLLNKIYCNGDIITLSEDNSEIEAVGVKGEKIISVGFIDAVKQKMPKDSQLIDLEGKTLLPGFIDCHLHPIIYLFSLLNPNLSEIKSIKELTLILQNATKDKSEDELIIGLNLREEDFEDPKERHLPDRWILDNICPNHPVFLLRYDGHIGIANSKALELAGIEESTPIPEGGEIRRDENGNINGILSEKAASFVLSKVSLPSPKSIKEIANVGFKNLASKGLTSLHGIVQLEAGGEMGDIGAYEVPILKSILDIIPQNWYIMVYTENPKKLNRLRKSTLNEENLYGKFKVNCLKLFLDGTFGAATACMFEPFSDQPDKCGFCTVDVDEIYSQMEEAHKLGYQICVHAIGDKGNRILVDLYKRLLEEHPKEGHRHRIEHASMLRDDVIKDIKNLGLIVSSQPPFINSEFNWIEKRIGKDRFSYTYPFKTIYENNIIMAAGSDCPVEDPDVIKGLHALVTRNGFVPEQCVSIEDALKAYTINAAYAAFEENVKGTIEEGKLADFVILDKNPLKIPKEKIKDLQVMETIIRGKTIFKKE